MDKVVHELEHMWTKNAFAIDKTTPEVLFWRVCVHITRMARARARTEINTKKTEVKLPFSMLYYFIQQNIFFFFVHISNHALYFIVVCCTSILQKTKTKKITLAPSRLPQAQRLKYMILTLCLMMEINVLEFHCIHSLRAGVYN